MKKFNNTLTYFFILCVVPACSTFDSVSLSSPEGHIVELKHDAWVKTLNAESSEKKKGEKITVTEPVLIESPGRVGVLVMPYNKSAAKIDLTLRPISNWSGDAAKIQVGNLLSEIVSELIVVQQDLNQGRPQSALDKVRALRKQFPSVGYLKFAEANCLVVLGQNSEAISVLNEALVEDPDNENARSLYRNIAGEEPKAK